MKRLQDSEIPSPRNAVTACGAMSYNRCLDGYVESSGPPVSPHLQQCHAAFYSRLTERGDARVTVVDTSWPFPGWLAVNLAARHLDRYASEIAHRNALAPRRAPFSSQSPTSRHRERRRSGDGVVTR